MTSAKMALFIALISVVPSFAIEAPQNPKSTGSNFEQHKADIIKRIDGRIARNQEEKSCIQAAKNHDDIKACRNKFKAESREKL